MLYVNLKTFTIVMCGFTITITHNKKNVNFWLKEEFLGIV